jgi:hypothetical protein
MATKPNKSIKVSQKTIDEVKKMGMSKALKEINNRANQGQGMGAAGKTMREEGMKLAKNSEFAEAVRRLYGDRRSAAARTVVAKTTTRGPSAAKAASKSAPGAGQPSGYRSTKQAGPKKASTSYSPAPKKASTKYSPVKKSAATKKKSGTTDPFARFVMDIPRALAEPFKKKK